MLRLAAICVRNAQAAEPWQCIKTQACLLSAAWPCWGDDRLGMVKLCVSNYQDSRQQYHLTAACCHIFRRQEVASVTQPLLLVLGRLGHGRRIVCVIVRMPVSSRLWTAGPLPDGSLDWPCTQRMI